MDIQNKINEARRRGNTLALSAYQAVLSSIQEKESRENKKFNEDQILGVIRKERDKYTEVNYPELKLQGL